LISINAGALLKKGQGLIDIDFGWMRSDPSDLDSTAQIRRWRLDGSADQRWRIGVNVSADRRWWIGSGVGGRSPEFTEIGAPGSVQHGEKA